MPIQEVEELTGAQALPLEALAAVPVSDLLDELGKEPPGYRSLYYRWERQQWEAGPMVLDGDGEEWTRRLFPEQRRAVLWLLAGSTAGEKQLAHTLVSFVDAAPSEEQGVFLTTQLADAGRHTVLFERFGGALDEDVVSMDVGWGPDGEIESGKALLARLSDLSEALRLDRESHLDLIRGVAAQHLLLQGVTALTSRTALLGWLQEQEILRGLVAGLMAVTRDEVRHVQFGSRFLKEHASSGAGRKALDETLESVAPLALSVLDSGGADLDSIGISAEGLRRKGTEALSSRLSSLGIDWEAESPAAGD